MRKEDLASAEPQESVALEDLRRAIVGLRSETPTTDFELGYDAALDDVLEALGLDG